MLLKFEKNAAMLSTLKFRSHRLDWQLSKLLNQKVTRLQRQLFIQGLLAIEAGADYLAPYYNRMENLNIDSDAVISQLAQAIERDHSASKILAASFKNVGQINRAFADGAQAITAGPDIFAAAFAMPSIAKAVDDFAADWSAIHNQEYI